MKVTIEITKEKPTIKDVILAFMKASEYKEIISPDIYCRCTESDSDSILSCDDQWGPACNCRFIKRED